MPFTLSLYRAGMSALSPLAPLWLGLRARAGKEDGARLGERFGRSAGERPSGALVWLHGASVGEMGVLLQLQAALAAHDPALHFLVTTGTRTSADLFAKRVPPRTRHVYAPLDTPGAAKRFVTHWRPDIGVFAESELWPNLILEAAESGVRLALVNALMSPKAIEGWGRHLQSAHRLLGAFTVLLAADDKTARGLSRLSGRAVENAGNLKFAAPKLAVDDGALARLRAEIAARPVWCAASTHEGEDEILIAAHEALLAEFPNALLIIAPRHPERGARIAALAGDAPRRAARQPISGPVYIADTMGELGLFYSAAPVSFVGGSLLPMFEGHNPIEPAKLGSAILSGPHISSFSDAYDALAEQGGAMIMRDAREIAAAVSMLWRDAGARAKLAAGAMRAASQGGAALDAAVDQLAALLPQNKAAHASA